MELARLLWITLGLLAFTSYEIKAIPIVNQEKNELDLGRVIQEDEVIKVKLHQTRSCKRPGKSCSSNNDCCSSRCDYVWHMFMYGAYQCI